MVQHADIDHTGLPGVGGSSFRYDPDADPATAVAVGHEYDDGGHNGFTWAPSDPTPSDVTTYDGFLDFGLSSTVRFYNKAWVPGASDVTIACAFDWATLVNDGHVGLYVAGATGNTPAEGIMVQANFAISTANAVRIDMYTITASAYTIVGSAVAILTSQYAGGPIYLRLTRLNSGPTWTGYFSPNGRTWGQLVTTSNKSLTIGAIGLRCATDSSTARAMARWIRGWASIVEKVGS